MKGLRRGAKIQMSHLSTSMGLERNLQRYCIKRTKKAEELEKANSSSNKMPEKDNTKCYYCGQNRHPNDGSKYGWRDRCPAKTAICKECKRTVHFVNMPACKAKRVSCIKIEDVHSTNSTNLVKIKPQGPDTSIQLEVEADN